MHLGHTDHRMRLDQNEINLETDPRRRDQTEMTARLMLSDSRRLEGAHQIDEADLNNKAGLPGAVKRKDGVDHRGR